MGRAGLAVVAAVGMLSAAAPAGRQPTFSARVRTVAVYATVIDRSGRLVPDLTRDDFQVFDNGRSVAISVFSNEPQPITAVVMLDCSNSMTERVLRVRDATERFIDALGPADRARIGTFGEEVAISPILTANHTTLKRVLREELWPGGGTPLWRGLLAAMVSLEGETGRRVVLVLSDGDNMDMWADRPDAGRIRRLALEQGYLVYAIGLQPVAGGQYKTGLSGELRDVAAETGGGHFELENDVDLGEAFVSVAEELRCQYVLGFAPATLDGKVHKLQVRVTRPGCSVRARKTYRAGGER